LGTYRPVDVMDHDHPLRTVAQDLRIHEPYNDICLDMLIFPAYVASKGSDHHQEAADVTGTSNRRRGVLHPAV